MRMSGRQINDLQTLIRGTVTSWGEWCFEQRWRRLFASVRWRSACSFPSPSCQRIRCCAILARKASGHVVSTKHSRVSFYCSLHFFQPRKLNTQLLLLSDLGPRFFNHELPFLYCGARKAFFGHFRHIHGQTVPTVPDLLALP